MAKVFKMYLPFPPSNNHAYVDRVIAPKGGGKPFVTKFLSKDAKEYKAQVTKMVMAEMQITGFQTMTKDVRLDVVLIVPDKRQRDKGNFDKVLEDALEDARLYNNDSQISEGEVIKKYIKGKKRIAIRATELETDVFGKAEYKVKKKRAKARSKGTNEG
jgi:crossover junction endodeoxyribonuclease RusA